MNKADEMPLCRAYMLVNMLVRDDGGGEWIQAVSNSQYILCPMIIKVMRLSR